MLVYQRVLQMLRSMSFIDSFSDHSSLQFTQVAIHLDILE
jgi:hypothetical protein